MEAIPQEPEWPALADSQPPSSQSTCALGLFTAISLLLLLTPLSPLLKFLFPALGFLCAVFVYSRSKSAYTGFVLWIWFLTPFVHRVVDMRAGTEQTILLTPYLVGGVASIFLLRNLHLLALPEMLPFTCAFSAIFYGLCIGSFRFDPLVVGSVLCEWLVPVLFAFFLYACPDDHEAIAYSFKTNLGVAVLLTAAYGIYQFVAAPAWDMNWLQSNVEEFVSIGKPEAMQFRVFSTMNSPPVFGVAMMTGLLLLPALKKSIRIPAAALGFVAMLLTASRSAWVGFAGGAIVLFSCANKNQRFRFALQIAGFALLLLFLLRAPVMGTFVSDRFKNVSNVQDDASFGDRLQGYKEAIGAIVREPFGEGLGSATVLHTGEVIGPHDSSFLESLYSLGWMGSLIYAGGLACAGLRGFQSSDRARGDFVRSGRAVIIAFAIQSPLNSIMLGQAGFFLWAVLALTLKEVHLQQPVYEQLPREQSPRLTETGPQWLGAWDSQRSFPIGFDQSKDPLGP